MYLATKMLPPCLSYLVFTFSFFLFPFLVALRHNGSVRVRGAAMRLRTESQERAYSYSIMINLLTTYWGLLV